ncbi:D-alanine--D-alanine ligase [Teredinibacter haidensis]|uniref:D-alanine--D-alanine ligase n=1 Tax=Teredinibacter haidensis TaxID=2731755 RepID=UPI000948BC62|nr:D-alanine--D-alanine ligase [Teredinibacter haidensis]
MSDKVVTRFQHLLNAEEGFGKVAVLYGGTSAEREVSLKSGLAVEKGLQELGIDAKGYDIGGNAVEQLLAIDFDRAFIALHGEGGEDGKIQAVLDLMGKPYTGSRHTASAIAMDKLKTKQIWLSEGLPTPSYRVIDACADMAEVLQSLGGEAFVKPVHEGSSIGMRCVSSPQALAEACVLANQFDSLVMAEQKISGAEFTVAVLNGRALPPVELQTDNTFYDYEAKYESSTTRYNCPCNLSVEKIQELENLAVNAFGAVGCRGWGRVDVMQNQHGDFFLLEVNTVPGMTDHSLVPMAARAAGLSFNELVCEILATTMQD